MNSDLEKLVKDFDQTQALSESYQKDSTNPQTIARLDEYVANYLTTQLENNSEDDQTQELIGGTLEVLGDIDFHSAPESVIRRILGTASSMSVKNLVDYVDSNYQDVLSGIEDEKKIGQLAFGVSPTKIGNESHDSIAKYHEKYLVTQGNLEEAKKGDSEAFANISEEINGLIQGDPVASSLAYFLNNDPQSMLRFYEGVTKVRQARFAQKLEGNEREYLTTNIENVEEKLKVPTYVGLAKAA